MERRAIARRSGASGIPALVFGLAAAIASVAAGCRGAPAGSGGGDGTTSTSGSDTAAATTFVTPDACMSSEDCETSGSCVAPYDPAPPDGDVGRGPAACVDACIETNDIQRWCIDDESCCEDLHCNGVDGFCERSPAIGSSGEPGSTTAVGSSSSGSSSGGTTTESSSGSTTTSDTGSSSDTGTSSSSSSSG